MTMARRQPAALHRLYGLTLRTAVPVGEPLASSDDADAQVDWTVEWADPPDDPTQPPDGSATLSEGVWPAVRNGQTVTLWHVVLGRVELDLDKGRISLGLTRRTDEVGALLLRGVVLALALELRGIPCLHANGVVVGGHAVAVAGLRGTGKTTVTAALCAAGTELLADDVVAIEHRDGSPPGWFARSGLTQLRLRADAGHLADLIGPQHPSRLSVDGRRVVVLPPSPRQLLPLAAILSPRIDVAADRPSLIPLRGAAAFAQLAVAFRIPTFLEAPMLIARLKVTADLAASVPVFALSMPPQATWTAADANALRDVVATALVRERR